MTARAISRAKDAAMNNGGIFHIAAILIRKKRVVRTGTNSDKTHPAFPRKYKNGVAYNLHAEMDVIRFAKPGDKVAVLRWSAAGELTMAKPCEHCHEFMKAAGISEVTYSDWNGNFQTFKF